MRSPPPNGWVAAPTDARHRSPDHIEPLPEPERRRRARSHAKALRLVLRSKRRRGVGRGLAKASARRVWLDRRDGGSKARHRAVDRADIPPRGPRDGVADREARGSTGSWDPLAPSGGCDDPGRTAGRYGVQQDMTYDHLEIEARGQRYWDEHGTFRATRCSGRPERYVLDMFPYSSGVGLHVRHPEGYTATDIRRRAGRPAHRQAAPRSRV